MARYMAEFAPLGGSIEFIGPPEASLTEAQIQAESFYRQRNTDHRPLSWRQFSGTTWGLMCGQVYTDVLITEIKAANW